MVNLWLMMVDDGESITGWWYTTHSEKYESSGMMTFQIYGEIKHVPNHQPAYFIA